MALAPPRTCAEVTWSEWRLDVLRDSRPVSGKYCSSITPVLGARGRVKNLLKMSSTCLDPPPRGSDVQMGRSCVTECPPVIVCEVYPGFSLFFLFLASSFFFFLSFSYFCFFTLKLSIAFSPLYPGCPLFLSPPLLPSGFYLFFLFSFNPVSSPSFSPSLQPPPLQPPISLLPPSSDRARASWSWVEGGEAEGTRDGSELSKHRCQTLPMCS